MRTIQILAFILFFPIIGYCQDLIETIKAGDFHNAMRLVNSHTVKQADENGATPLMWAVYKGNLELSRYLVENGAELKIKGVVYLDPEKQSYYGSLTGIAAGEGNLEMLRFLIEELEIDEDAMEFDPLTKEATGWTALHWAAYKGYTDIAEHLINKKADINAINPTDGCTPLIYAVIQKNYEVAHSLLISGANSEVVNNYGFAALHYLSWRCCWEQIEWIVENGGNINLLSKAGFTPLMYIQAYCVEVNDSVVTNLIEKGAIVDNDLVNSFYYRDQQLKTYYKENDYEKALHYALEAMNCAKRDFGLLSPNYAISLHNIGSIYIQTEKYHEAADYLLQALNINKYNLDQMHEQLKTLENLAVLYEKWHNIDKAYEYRVEILSLENEFGIKDTLSHISNLRESASLLRKIGENSKSLEYFEHALQYCENNSFINTLSCGNLFNSYAGLLGDLNQHDKAYNYYLKALDIFENEYGIYHKEYLNVLNNFALLRSEMGYYEDALALQIILLENSDTTNNDYPTFLSNTAQTLRRLGDFEQALSLSQRALEIEEHLNGDTSNGYGRLLNNIAFLYYEKELYIEAIPMYKIALDIAKNNYGVEHIRYGNRLNNIALTYYASNQHHEAYNYFKSAQDNAINNLENIFSFMTETEKYLYADKVMSNCKIYQSFYRAYYDQNQEVSKPAYDIALATNGMILSTGMNMRKVIQQSNDVQLKTVFDEWLGLKHSINHLQNTPISQSSVDSLIHAANRLERELSRHSQEFGEMQAAFRIKLEDVQKGLTENEVAIEFLSFKYHDGKRWTDSTFYCALVITKDCEYPHMIFLFEEQDLLDLQPDPTHSNHWDYNLVYQGARASGTVFFEQETHRGDKLYELIWQPIDSLLQDKGIETIYFAPSGLLHTVSFAAIPTPDGELLMEKYNLVQLGSTRTVAIQQEAVELKTAVVFGGIDYDLEGEELELIALQFRENESFAFQYMPYRASDTRYGGFTYLEGSLVEAQKVSALLSEKISTTKITGRDAIEESFKALSGSHAPSVIHIATHGFYFPDTISDKSREQMMFAAIGEERFRISDDPLMRSALMMAGANHAWQGKPLPPGVQDGILTARDVSAMNLANTELVVLSACQTGLGDVKGSEGVTGLQRAFKMAGVRYIIMSLWPVPDKETVEFMEAFYGNWLGGMEIRTAFTATQKQMHKRYPNEPFKWAAFVLME